ncbi:RNA polymerase sigma factor [Labilithrix luteola]|uniref:RNA polymerase sigma factor n=1 Tax=Labilithrix luteola TaxID=1391654 RepID=UPI001969FC51|nr:RNA polymerase sigma factor [Labilithrix luteola]
MDAEPGVGKDLAVPTFDEVYAEHFDYVWQTARRLGVKDHAIDDVVQEAFLTIHKLLPRYEPRNALRGWLYAIVVRTTLHHHRAHRRHGAKQESDRELIEQLPDSNTPGPDTSAEKNEHVDLLERLLDELNSERRAVFVLAAFEQQSVSEIAAILDVNRNTVAARLRAAREQIQASLVRHRARDGWRLK